MTPPGSHVGLATLLVCAAAAAAAAACSDDAAPADAGDPDTGLVDSGAHDSSTTDTGATDAGVLDGATLDTGLPDAGASDTLGTVGAPATVTCPASTSLIGAWCEDIIVQCPSVPDILATVRVNEPAAGTLRGTVVLSSGGGGTNFYGGVNATPGGVAPQALVQRLVNAGFRTVENRWGAPWERGPGGMRRAGCRYATLLTWVYDRIFDRIGGLCATGNSGGSSQIAYALAHYNREVILDFAVPTGGPPMGRMDHGCLDGPGTTWFDTECPALLAMGTTASMPQCAYTASARRVIDMGYTPDVPCGSLPDGGVGMADPTRRMELLTDSVAAPDADYNYRTPLVFIYGTGDGTSAAPLGLAYATRVTSMHMIRFAMRTPHGVQTTVPGQTAIFTALSTGCPRP